MKNQSIEKKIEQFENRNRFLTNEISQLNTDKITKDEQKRIDGNFQEIEINNQFISKLK